MCKECQKEHSSNDQIIERSVECNDQAESGTKNLHDGFGSYFEYTGKTPKKLVVGYHLFHIFKRCFLVFWGNGLQRAERK